MDVMKPKYDGKDWSIYEADTVEVMAGLPQNCIDMSVYSPPFSDLFVYSDSERDMGNCGSHAEFMQHYEFMARGLLNAIKPGRIACVHCTDLPTRKNREGYIGIYDFPGDLIRAHLKAGWIQHGRVTIWKDPLIEATRTKALGLLYKQTAKDTCMSRVGLPDYLLFFRKPGENKNSVKQDHATWSKTDWQELASPVWMTIDQTHVLNKHLAKADSDEKHICPLQLDVIDRALRLYSNAGDVVLDPFNGIGSSGYQALKRGRKYIGIELKPEYAAQASKFLKSVEAEEKDLFA